MHLYMHLVHWYKQKYVYDVSLRYETDLLWNIQNGISHNVGVDNHRRVYEIISHNTMGMQTRTDTITNYVSTMGDETIDVWCNWFYRV